MCHEIKIAGVAGGHWSIQKGQQNKMTQNSVVTCYNMWGDGAFMTWNVYPYRLSFINAARMIMLIMVALHSFIDRLGAVLISVHSVSYVKLNI